MTSPAVKIASIRDLGPQLTDNPHQMVGQDGAYSIPLNNGQTLFFFGDTLIGSRVPGESIWYPGGQPVGPKDMSGRGSIRRMVNNCGLLIDNHDARNGLRDFKYILDDDGEIRTLIPLLPDEHHDEIRVWCMHGIAIGEKIYLFFVKVEMLNDGPFPVNFDILGSGMAVGTVGEWKFERVYHNGSDLFWRKKDPQFGSAALLSADKHWIYLYGVKMDAQFVQQSHLARVPVAALEDRDSYEFFAGDDRWRKNVDDAVPVFDGPPNEQSVNWNEYLGCYLAVHSLNITGKIVARTAPQPWGPWSEPVEITQITPVRQTPLPYPPLVYAAKAHPSLSRENGRIIYVTYVEFEEYYPHLLEITLIK